MDWDISHNWLKTIERKLNDLGSKVKGNQDFQSDRILDVVEQVGELRKELDRVSDTQKKIADFVKEHVKHDKRDKTTTP